MSDEAGMTAYTDLTYAEVEAIYEDARADLRELSAWAKAESDFVKSKGRSDWAEGYGEALSEVVYQIRRRLNG